MPTYGLETSEFLTRILDYANITNIEGASAKGLIALNDALRRLASKRRWVALRRQGTITPVASTQSYALTGLTGFNYPVRVFYIINGVEKNIPIVSDEVWSQENDNDTTGDPCICSFLEISGAIKIYLSPLPSASFASTYPLIYIDYDKKPSELTGAVSEVPDIPPTNCQMALVYYAVAELLAKQGDVQGVGLYEGKAEAELNNYFKADIHFRGVKRQKGKPSFGILDGTYTKNTGDYS